MKTKDDILKEINLGEDSSRQFKREIERASDLAKEICALSNSVGGTIFIGIADDQSITGLSADQIRTYNGFISAAANEQIRPSVYPKTQIIELDEKKIIVIEVPEGYTKPYCDKDGAYWVKSGSDKRKASPQELLRLFQDSSQISLDETLTSAPVEEIDRAKFYGFFEKISGEEFSASGLTIEKALANMNLAKNGLFNLGGLLLFGSNVQKYKPYCMLRAISYPGVDLSDDVFIDKQDCTGTIEEQFRSALIFLQNNLKHIQKGESFNSVGELEINKNALEEALVNALLHRDYSKNSLIRLFVFKDRVELISPGSLPNHLSIENIKNGNSVMRNFILSSFGTKILPYTGIGSGVRRIVKNHPQVEFINDKDGQQFIVKFKRVGI